MSSISKLRLGYLIPEFPGQTHIFFWRELSRLKRLGAEPVVFSTRPPSNSLVCHDWSQQAASACHYLLPSSLPTWVRSLGDLALCGPAALMRARRLLQEADPTSAGSPKLCAGLLVAGAALKRRCGRMGIEHVHVHSCGRSALIGMLARAMGGPAYSITLHGPLEDYGGAQAAKWSHSRFAIVITQKLKAEVHKTLAGHLPPRVAIAPMGVDTDVFRRDTCEAYEPWAGQGRLRLFACGRLNPCKGHDDLVRVLALLQERGVEAELSIAGADDGGGRYRTSLEALAQELGVADRLTLLGPVDEKVIRRHLAATHIFTLASLREPLGVAIMEAMAMGLPVVVTHAGGVRELVDHDVDGWTVSPQAPAEMADAVEQLAKDPALCRRLGDAAIEKVRARFDSTVSAEQLLRLIEETRPGAPANAHTDTDTGKSQSRVDAVVTGA